VQHNSIGKTMGFSFLISVHSLSTLFKICWSFWHFQVPRWNEADSEQQLLTRANPFLLPKPYLLAQQHRVRLLSCHLMAAISGFYVRMGMISNVPVPYIYHATSCLVMTGYRGYCLYYLVAFHFCEQCKVAESWKQNLKTTT
jgi:hypothetical protein